MRLDLGNIGSYIARTITGMGEGYRAYQRYHDLTQMSDRQLRQRGLKRSDMVGAAFERDRH